MKRVHGFRKHTDCSDVSTKRSEGSNGREIVTAAVLSTSTCHVSGCGGLSHWKMQQKSSRMRTIMSGHANSQTALGTAAAKNIIAKKVVSVNCAGRFTTDRMKRLDRKNEI